MTTMKQPFQCNLQPEIQEPHRTTHTDTTTRCKTHRRNNSRTKRPQPHPSHRRGTFHRRLQPLYTEKQGFVLRLPPQNIAHATFMQPLQCDLQPPFIKVKSQSHTTLQGQVSIRSASTLHQGHVKSHTTLQGQLSIAHHPSRSSLNRTPPFKIKSQSCSTLQGQVSIRSATTLHQGHVKSHTTLQGQLSIAHHPSRSSLNRTPPFKIKSQSRTTLQGQVSIAHHPSHHPSRSSVNRAPPFLNRAPPFKVKSQSHTTLQGQVSIAHHPSSFQDSEFYLSVPRKYCFPTSFDYILISLYLKSLQYATRDPKQCGRVGG